MRRGVAIALVGGLAALSAASSASANFHLMKVREVATNPAGANSAFIELQMYAPGQNVVGGHPINYYTATGALLGTYELPSNVGNGDSQRTILIGDTATAGTPDFVNDQLADALQTYGPGGAVCFDTIDCVSWGNFTGAALLPSPTGSPAPAIADGSSLTRSIAPGCATLLEAADDTDNGAADFALTTPSPRNNSTAPTETACDPGGGGDDTTAPTTKIKKGPKGKIDTDTATVKFKSNEQGSSFECKLDRAKYKSCKSPKKLKNLKEGKHKFKVRATDAAGNTDSTPAKLRFKVVD